MKDVVVAAMALAFMFMGMPPVARAQEDTAADTPAVEGAVEAPVSQTQGPLRRSNRIEFDERLIKGQTASSGAVYLFTRTPRSLPALVPLRRSYRKRIVEPVLGDRPLEPMNTSGVPLDPASSQGGDQ